jgi:hypothetical protein
MLTPETPKRTALIANRTSINSIDIGDRSFFETHLLTPSTPKNDFPNSTPRGPDSQPATKRPPNHRRCPTNAQKTAIKRDQRLGTSRVLAAQ